MIGFCFLFHASVLSLQVRFEVHSEKVVRTGLNADGRKGIGMDGVEGIQISLPFYFIGCYHGEEINCRFIERQEFIFFLSPILWPPLGFTANSLLVNLSFSFR